MKEKLSMSESTKEARSHSGGIHADTMRRAVKLTGSGQLAWVIERICFRFTNMNTIKEDGWPWWAGNYDYWQRELGYSYDQTKYAFEQLRKAGLIETKAKLDYRGKKMLHTTLTPKVLEALWPAAEMKSSPHAKIPHIFFAAMADYACEHFNDEATKEAMKH